MYPRPKCMYSILSPTTVYSTTFVQRGYFFWLLPLPPPAAELALTLT